MNAHDHDSVKSSNHMPGSSQPDIGLERAIVGALIQEPAFIPRVRQALKPEYFFSDRVRVCYSTLLRMADRGAPMDSLLLGKQLDHDGALQKAGGLAFVTLLTDGVPLDRSLLDGWVGKVRENALKRKASNFGRTFAESACNGRTVAELAGMLSAQLQELNLAPSEALFHTVEDFENAPALGFAIDGFLQNDAATVIGALSGHGKTWVLLSLAKALLRGKGAKLWGHFDVLESAERVVYLIPESTIAPFGHRVRLMGLLGYVRQSRLLVRTLSAGPRPSLADPRILAAVNGAHVMLDTLVRFNDVDDENSAAEFQALAANILGLLAAGARSVIAAHHAPKSFDKEKRMTLEGVLRGSGDIGAIFATGWGCKQMDAEENIVHVENVKARDFQACGPFELVGRPSIDEMGDFAMLSRPGDCLSLEETHVPERNRGGAPAEDRNTKVIRIEMLERWLNDNPHLTSRELVAKFLTQGHDVKNATVRGYKRELEARKKTR